MTDEVDFSFRIGLWVVGFVVVKSRPTMTVKSPTSVRSTVGLVQLVKYDDTFGYWITYGGTTTRSTTFICGPEMKAK